MKLTPSSTVRRSTALASSRLAGSPQIPSPVTRMAPNPRRLTVRSPPTAVVPAAPALFCSGNRRAYPLSIVEGGRPYRGNNLPRSPRPGGPTPPTYNHMGVNGVGGEEGDRIFQGL